MSSGYDLVYKKQYYFTEVKAKHKNQALMG